MALMTVKIRNGMVSGVPCGNPSYTVFRGIPYARQPVGVMRWKAPQPCESWNGVRKCDTFGPMSVQVRAHKGSFEQKEFFPTELPMSEACLTLNVWTPAESAGGKLPVMVWFHGGEFVRGSAHQWMYDGEAFCKRGVILVSVNYRLGAFGFFAHPELTSRDSYSGNYGLRDQVMALEWVRNNIAAFGGDAHNVTAFGQRSGGSSVAALLAGERGRHLIHKAIFMSSTGVVTLSGAFTHAECEQFGVYVCEKTHKSLDELKAMPAEKLAVLVQQAMDEHPDGRRIRLGPAVDGEMLPENPGIAIANAHAPDIPILIGSAVGDGGDFLGGVEQAGEPLRLAAALVRPCSLARAQNLNRRVPAYVYYFDRTLPGGDADMVHSGDLWYLFGTLLRSPRPFTGLDFELSNRMIDYWTNFAKCGDPNGEGLPEWTPFTGTSPLTIRLLTGEMADFSNTSGLRDMVDAQMVKAGLTLS